MLRAIAHMHRPHRNQLTKLDSVNGVVVPEAHGENTSVVSELNLEVALGGFVLLAGLGDVVEVDDAAHENEVLRARLEAAQVGFFVV